MAEQPYKRTAPKKRVQELQDIEADLERFTPRDGPDPRARKEVSPPAKRTITPRKQPKTGSIVSGKRTYNTT